MANSVDPDLSVPILWVIMIHTVHIITNSLLSIF